MYNSIGFPQRLMEFFVYHSNRIYYGKSHLVNRLPELQPTTQFRNLGLAMEEMQADIQQQMARIELILVLLDRPLQTEVEGEIDGIVNFAYNKIKNDESVPFTDLSLIYYLQMIETIEMSCFKLMRMAAIKIGHRQVKQLLKENYDEAKENRLLLMLLATEQIMKQ